MADAFWSIEVSKIFEVGQGDSVQRHTGRDIKWAVDYLVGQEANDDGNNCSGCKIEGGCKLGLVGYSEHLSFADPEKNTVVKFKVECDATEPDEDCLKVITGAAQKVSTFLDQCEKLDTEIADTRHSMMTIPLQEATRLRESADEVESRGEAEADRCVEMIQSDFRQTWLEPAVALASQVDEA